MTISLEERLDELEVRFTHQSLLVEELNEVVTQCNLRIEQLGRENRQLREMIKGLQPLLEESPDE